ncbi:MAG: hypothetical protein E8D45_04315 [Nitrospira sp.]|nr:MAG: hypothetical protein E8D45_04315 [Nitrospira sp.]
MNNQQLNRILSSAIAVLGLAFLAQIAINTYLYAPPRVTAAWAYDPRDIAEAKGLAKEIVEAQVVKVERGDDIVINAPGEPGGVERIAVEVVTLKTIGRMKGEQAQEVRVFHTLGMPAGFEAPPNMKGAPPKPKDGIDPPARIFPTVANTVNIHDDPLYQPGERYLMFLREGPPVKIKGRSVATHSLLSPTTRLLIRPDNKVEPMSQGGVGFLLRGQNVEQLRKTIAETPERGPVPGKLPDQLVLPPGPAGITSRGIDKEVGADPSATEEIEVPTEGKPPK